MQQPGWPRSTIIAIMSTPQEVDANTDLHLQTGLPQPARVAQSCIGQVIAGSPGRQQ